MLCISREAKNAFKVALSLVIAYAIALSQDWGNPYWAVFAIIFTNLSSVGQSIGKAGLRLLGTLAAPVSAFTILSIFPQSRWMFLALMSIYLFFCVYMSTGVFIPYFFKVAGFVSLIICLKGGVNTEYTFQVAVLRILETGMGIIVATLVNILVWPEMSSKKLTKIVADLLESFKNQYQQNLNNFQSLHDDSSKINYHIKSRALLMNFSAELTASTIDTFEFLLSKNKWKYFEATICRLFDGLEVLRESIWELESVDINKVFINLDEVNMEIFKRLDFLINMCNVKTEAPDILPVALLVDVSELKKGSTLDRANLELVRKRINKINRLCGDLVECIALKKKSYYIEPNRKFSLIPVVDRERIIPALRVVLTLWATSLLWIYVRVPGGTGFIVMGTSLGMAFITSPKVSIFSMIKPAGLSIIFAAILYVFIIPRLSSFYSLGIIIFGFAFLVSYIFRKKEQTMSRIFGLGMTFAIAPITNVQQHSFLLVASSAIMFGLIILILILMTSFPESMYPGNVLSGLLHRFWSNSEKLFSNMNQRTGTGCVNSRVNNVYYYNVKVLPDKMSEWGSEIKIKRFSEVSSSNLEEITDVVRAVAIHIEKVTVLTELISKNGLMEQLETYFMAYRERIAREFLNFSDVNKLQCEKETKSLIDYRVEINRKMDIKIKSYCSTSKVSGVACERVYRLIAHYNAIVSVALRYSMVTSTVDIGVLKELRL